MTLEQRIAEAINQCKPSSRWDTDAECAADIARAVVAVLNDEEKK